MKTIAPVLVAAVAVFLMTGSPVTAGVIAGYDFGTWTGQFSPTTLDANASATNMAAGSGSEAAFSLSVWWADNPPYPYPMNLHPEHAGNYNGVEASAVAGDTYFAFTVSANSGYELDLSQLAFRHNAGATGGQAMEWWLYSSVDGFTSPNHIAWASTPDDSAWHTNNVNLTASKFQHLTSIDFRMYFDSHWNNQGFYDDFSLTGTVAPAATIPEPGTVALLGTGVLVLLGVIRRRRTK